MSQTSSLQVPNIDSFPSVYMAEPPSTCYNCYSRSSELFYRLPLTSASIIVSITYLALDYATGRLIMGCNGIVIEVNNNNREEEKELFLFELFNHKYKYEIQKGHS